MKRPIISSVVSAMAGSLLIAGAALAQEYPERPITLVIPYGPGGAADLSARLIAGNAPSTLGQSILPVNKAGAAGVTGSNFVLNAKKDGYTLLSARVGSQMGVPAMNKTIPYNWDDFTVIGMTELNPFILTVSADSPYQTFADFEKAVKEGTELTYSSAGVGTLLHIATAVMADAMGADPDKLTHVPYKGGGIPDVPTASEVGYPNLEQIIGWSAIYGPPDLPEEIVATWTDTLTQLNDNAAWLKLTKGLGNIVAIMGPEETKAFVEKQYNVFDAAIEKLGMRIE